jgi:multisubunit Na+/H+ antiporter MnhF subunit
VTAYEICLAALLIGGLGPAVILASFGDPVNRLVGLDMAAAVITFALVLFSEVGPGQSYDLILPLVLVPLSFAGTLVFTRLLAPPSEEPE